MADTLGKQIATGQAPAPIGVGVTGHRPGRLGEADLTMLEARLYEIMAAIEAAAPSAQFRLIGSLAEGADTLAAGVAVARGWQVDAVLPLARDDYIDDFEGDAAVRLQSLLSACRSIFELPGERGADGGPAASYERAGRVVLTQSDFVLAIWDGDPALGRGGTTQIILEAVAQGVPVLAVHPADGRAELLWSGLNAHDLGPETIDTIARGGIDDLPRLLGTLASSPVSATKVRRMRTWPLLAIAYPMLLAATGVKTLRMSDLRAPRPSARPKSDTSPAQLEGRIDRYLMPQFDEADRIAARAAQLFRSTFVSNLALAAFATTLSLFGLIAPKAIQPLLAVGEFAAVARILLVTHVAGRAGWHGYWLERRQIAEQLRCLAVSAQLGDLLLRGGTPRGEPATEEVRRVARMLGLPSVRVDTAFLATTRARLLALLDDQIVYLGREAGRLHRLEHRLHRFGGILFTISAVICVGVVVVSALGVLMPGRFGVLANNLPVSITVVSASLPAIGAAIYGIRMQGDFAGIVERDHVLAAQLGGLRRIAMDEAANFDNLRRLAARTTELLVADLAQWLHSSRARPLTLPG